MKFYGSIHDLVSRAWSLYQYDRRGMPVEYSDWDDLPDQLQQLYFQKTGLSAENNNKNKVITNVNRIDPKGY